MARKTDWSGAGLAIASDKASGPGGPGGPGGIAGLAQQGTSRRDAGRVLRVLALVAVATGLAVLTAAACVLSYGSIHALATDAGISAPLARLYPLIFDALLVLAGCSVLALRGAGIVSRIYAWLCLLILLAGLAAGGVVHAAGITLPKRPAEIAAAIIPFALVLVGFGLLLALLRYARQRKLGQRRTARSQVTVTPQPAVPAGATQTAEPAQALELPRVPDHAQAPELARMAEGARIAEGARVPDHAPIPEPAPVPELAPVQELARVAERAPMAERANTAGQPVQVPAVMTAADAPASAGPAETGPGTVKTGLVKMAARPAQLQLRARVPRQPAGDGQPGGDPQPGGETEPEEEQHAATGPSASHAPDPAVSSAAPGALAQAGCKEPFMPPVSEQRGPAPVAKARKTNPRLAKGGTVAATEDRNVEAVSKDREAASATNQGGVPAVSNNGKAPAASPAAATLGAGSTSPGAEAGTQAKKAQANAGKTPAGQPPAFERPHSSPNPPEG